MEQTAPTSLCVGHQLEQTDPELASIIGEELSRQRESIELIASENFTSPAVMEAVGSVLTNKYAEGYPAHRYYGGCEKVDKAEVLAIERACKLFNCSFANVQAHSGSSANLAAYLACVEPGDTVMGMDRSAGGHLTHGTPVNFSGKWFRIVTYGLDPETEIIDYDALERTAKKERPKLLIAGASAYPRIIDFKRIGEIAHEVGAVFMVDMAHIAGLVATGFHPSPFPHADIVTSTSHKTLRGPRGGFILTNNEEWARRIDKAIFPGAQGGPLMHVIAGKAVAFGEALRPSFHDYIAHVLENASAMGDALIEGGLRLVSGGTDNHLCLVDLTAANITGKDAEILLESIGLTTNKNAIPGDVRGPAITSGIRLGSAAASTRGLNAHDFTEIGHCIAEAVFHVQDTQLLDDLRKRVAAISAAHPLYTAVS